MNVKSLILIALAFLLVFAVFPASAAHEYYDNKIVPYDPIAAYNALPQNQHSTLVVRLICNSNSLTKEFVINKVDETNPLPEFTSGAKVMKEFYDLFPLTGEATTFEFDSVGRATLNPAPGVYAILVHDGFSTWDEYAIVRVTKGYESTATLYGQYATGGDTVVDPTCKNKIVDVTTVVDGLVRYERWHGWRVSSDYLFIDSDYSHLHYNALFGDPDVNVVKELRIVYKWERMCGSPFWNLNIQSARYGTFCNPIQTPGEWQGVTINEKVDTHIPR